MNENNLWLDKWEKREIGFNQKEVSIFMLKYFKNLNLEKGRSVFVPLCGKTIEISWLLEQGHKVVGVELSEMAVKELFEELNLKANIVQLGEHILYSSEMLNVFVGDIFNLSSEMIGKIDAIYDRAAIVALKQEVRVEYVKKLRELTQNAPQLLISIEYEESLSSRTPYCVNENEVREHYAQYYDIELLERKEIAGGFKGKFPAWDVAWLLKA